MKTLIVFLLCTISCSALIAQVPADSSKNTPPSAMDSAGSINNSMRSDSVLQNSTNNSTKMNSSPSQNNQMRIDSVRLNNSTNNSTNMNSSSSQNSPTMRTDSTSLNNSMNNGRTDSMNSSSSGQSNSTLGNTNVNSNTGNSMNNTMSSNNRALVNPMNIQGQSGYAALPVLETYIPDMVLSKVKEKYGSTVYDISAVQIANVPDSGMAMQNSTTQNGTAAGKPATTTQANADSSNTVSAVAQNPSVPVQYNYVVRFQKNGALATETINTEGTVVNSTNAVNNQ